MIKKKDDGLEWLRAIRKNIAAKCGDDIHAISEYYRAAAARIPHRSYQGDSLPKRSKRKVLDHADGFPFAKNRQVTGRFGAAGFPSGERMKNRTGAFYISCRVENPVHRKSSAEVSKLLVDSSAEFTWINAETLKQIGVKREKKGHTFVMANGQQITRAVGFAIIRVGDALTTDEVIFGQAGDPQILGARSLAGMNLRVDLRAKKLVAGGPILAA